MVVKFLLKFHVLRRYGGKVVTTLGTPETLRTVELSWVKWQLGYLELVIKEI